MDGRSITKSDLHLILVPPTRTEAGPGEKPLADWHGQLWNLWSPILKKIAPTLELDQPQSSLPHQVQRLRRLGKAPVVIQFRPPHQVYPWHEAPLVVATHWGHGSIPKRPLFNDVRWNWGLTLPYIQGLLTCSQLTREAWEGGGFSGETLFLPAGSLLQGMPKGTSRESITAHRLPVGPPAAPEVRELWQEVAEAPRGLAKKSYFWMRKTYHHQIKDRVPGWLNRSVLGSWKWVRRRLRGGSAPAWLHPAPLDNPACVIALRWDPLEDYQAGKRILAAVAQGLEGTRDTALVVRMPEKDGKWRERLLSLANLAEHLPTWNGALLAQSDSGNKNPGDCLPRLDWAITWETGLEGAQWAEHLRCSGVGLIGTDASCFPSDSEEFPGFRVSDTEVPSYFPGVEDKLLESWRPQPRAESLRQAVAQAAQATLAGKAPSFDAGLNPEDVANQIGHFLRNLHQRPHTLKVVA